MTLNKHYDAQTLNGDRVPPPPMDLIESLTSSQGGGVSFGPDICPHQAASILIAIGKLLQLYASKDSRQAVVTEMAQKMGGPEVLAHLVSKFASLPDNPTYEQVAEIFKPNTMN